MNVSQALQALLSLRPRNPSPEAVLENDPGEAPIDETTLSGASFPSQEPALSQELRLTGEDVSGWAMGGSSLSD